MATATTPDETRAARRVTRRARRARPATTSTKVRGGDVGSLPAVLGLVVLVIVFSALRARDVHQPFNFANLINQSAGVMVIAMGLVFVLLLGEIDLVRGLHRRHGRRGHRHRGHRPRLALAPGDPGRPR